MTHATDHLSTGITRRSWSGLVLVWLAVSLPFVFLYLTSRRVVLNEVRNHAMGVAIAAAAGLQVSDLEAVRGPADTNGAPYHRTQQMLDRLVISNPDVRYIYTMRRSPKPFAPPSAYEYVVDQPARDFNHDGEISADEGSEPPGKPYDASELPALQEAWQQPSADREITPDPPYPDLISGYAPVRDENGNTIAIVGVDVTAATVHGKLRAVQVVMVIVWLVVCILITLVIQLYYQQRDAFEQNKALNEELAARNDLLRKANEELALFNREARTELEHVQHGLEPTHPPSERVVYDTYDIVCAASGSDLVRVFEIDRDRLGLYLAEVDESGVSAALVMGLLDLAVTSARNQDASASGTIYTDLSRPEAVMRTMHDVLVKELPAGETVGFAYAVIGLADEDVRLCIAGLPPPLQYVAAAKQVQAVPCTPGPALGAAGWDAPTLCSLRVAEGDKLVFCSNRLTRGAGAGAGYSAQALAQALARAGARGALDIASALRRDVNEKTGRAAATLEGSLLVAHLR